MKRVAETSATSDVATVAVESGGGSGKDCVPLTGNLPKKDRVAGK